MVACSVTGIDSPVYLRCMGMPEGCSVFRDRTFVKRESYYSCRFVQETYAGTVTCSTWRPYRDQDTRLFRFIELDTEYRPCPSITTIIMEHTLYGLLGWGEET